MDEVLIKVPTFETAAEGQTDTDKNKQSRTLCGKKSLRHFRQRSRRRHTTLTKMPECEFIKSVGTDAVGPVAGAATP